MGKRRSSDEKRSHLLKKIKKLEKQVKKLDPDADSEDSVVAPLSNTSETHVDKENNPPETVVNIQPENDMESTCPEMLIDVDSDGEVLQDETLEVNVLEILGVAPESENVLLNLHKQIAERWDVIIKKGLTKEEKEKLQKENPAFSNFHQMIPPKLNPEVIAAVNDIAKKRDQIIQKRQQQVATALSCLGSGLQLCLKDIENQKMEIIKKLNDASRLLCDSLYLDTRGRRSLLLSAINKDMKEFLLQSEADNYLFGENLTDKIKTVKSVHKSGKELKIADTYKKFVPRQTNTSSARPSNFKNKDLNWRGPPRPDAKKRWAAGGPSTYRPPVDKKKDEKTTHRGRK